MRSHTVSDRSSTPGPVDRSADLVDAIDQTGYYPLVVAEGVRAAIAGEPVLSFLVHHEPTIDRDEVRRHITVAVLTPTRLLVAHTDEHAPDDLLPEPYTSTSTEAVGLGSVVSVVVSRMVANPAEVATVAAPDPSAGPAAGPGAGPAAPGLPLPAEAVLTIGWGGVGRLDLEPAMCSDANCDADHGYTGVISSDDFSIRVSSAADGQDAVDELLAFAEVLSAHTHSR